MAKAKVPQTLAKVAEADSSSHRLLAAAHIYCGLVAKYPYSDRERVVGHAVATLLELEARLEEAES